MTFPCLFYRGLRNNPSHALSGCVELLGCWQQNAREALPKKCAGIYFTVLLLNTDYSAQMDGLLLGSGV